jgi:hypothetical protein
VVVGASHPPTNNHKITFRIGSKLIVFHMGIKNPLHINYTTCGEGF